jgi:integration host factor subunit alpha
MTLTKAELAECLMQQFNLSKRDAKALVEAFFEEMAETLVRHGEMKISGFGNFATRDKRSRPGRNPKTGETVMITPRRVVTFRAGLKLKRKIEALAERQAVLVANN